MNYVLGRVLGFIFMFTLIKPLRIIYGIKKCSYKFDKDEMQKLQGRSMIIVSNHIKPRNKFLKLISIPYDAFMIRHFLLLNGIYSTALTSYDAGKVKRGEKVSSKKKRKEALIKGIVESIDCIPLNRNEKDETTTNELRKRIAKGNLGIGMFPEGTFYRGFRKNRKIFSGAAVLSKKYELPILVVYIKAYNLNAPCEIKMGGLISYELPSETISNTIREELNRLYKL